MKRVLLSLLLATTASCAAWLGLAERDTAAPFPHRAHVTSGVSCPECHTGISEAADEGPLHLPTDDTCRRCHVAPHDNRSCNTCHTQPLGAERVAQARTHLRFSHASHGQKKVVNCARCHEGVATDAPSLLPPMAACLSCHAHEGGFRPERCGDCHRDLQDERVRPLSHFTHGPDYLARHGSDAGTQRQLCNSCHSDESCARCHGASVPPLAYARAFRPSADGRLHAAGFRARHGLEARAQPGTCLSCHQPESCGTCHAERDVAATGALRRGPHPTGWVSATGDNLHGPAARLDPLSCASCHSGAGESLCVGCHKVGAIGGSPHPLGWRSEKRSSELPCRLCHMVGSLP